MPKVLTVTEGITSEWQERGVLSGECPMRGVPTVSLA
ncbi:MAG: hypothetical protein FD174_632 [Geobacteraceae bacterium]|nr:MAG: hypothetical protein FD174_632 [Geobacteraceae bacterium]